MSKKEKLIMDKFISKGAKIRDGMVALPWVTEESKRHKKMPHELWNVLLALASKYGIGGVLNGVSILCGRAQDGLGGRPLEDVGKKIFLLMLETNDMILNTQFDKEREENPLIHAVKSKLIN